MANRKISDLTALTAPATGDLLPIVDISEAAAADKNKKITIGELFASIPLGSAAAPSIAFEGDSNTGIYSPGADTLAFVEGGTEAARITSAGFMGLGTSSPISLFNLSGGYATVSYNSDDYRLRWQRTDGTFVGGLIVDGYNKLTFRLADAGGTTQDRIIITSAGDVGIGTASPGSLLHLADAGNITVGTTTGTKIGTATTQKLSFYNATPVVQPTAVANATTAVDVITQLNALLAKLRTLGIIAT
jgi:hypothetical protein